MSVKNELFFLFVLVCYFLVANILLYAQEVLHNGNLVDSDDPKICLTCHNGIIAKNISPCTKIRCLLEPNSSHPVFKKYPPSGKESEYAPSFQVEAAGIILKNGEVTCISCHNLMNQEGFHLVMENKRSRLCKTCHIR